MKKASQFILLILCFACPLQLQAKHVAGGELTYQWVGDSTYHFIFKLYKDCVGIDAQNTLSAYKMCYRDDCGVSNDSTVLNEIGPLPDGSPNCSEVSTGCAGIPSTCTNISSSLAGYRECWFEGYLTLPARCNKWHFSVAVSARNINDNIVGNGGGNNDNFYVEATLDNLHAQGNSSAYYTVRPVPFVCVNDAYTYNNGAADINNDSLSFSLMHPQTQGSGSALLCNTPVSSIPFSNTNLYNLVNNPLATGNTFSLNPVTGELHFTPNAQGKYTITLLVQEYRNNMMIGSTMRDIQIYVDGNCSVPTPTFALDPLSITGAHLQVNTIENCANNPLTFCFAARSTSSSAVLAVSDNHVQVTPGATITYTGGLTSMVRGCLSWTPHNADTGLKILTVTVKDSTCAQGVAISQTFTIPVYINPNTYTNNDTDICHGSSLDLTANGGSNFTWTVLPGGSPINSLSCTNCATPIASPGVTTTYIVTSNQITQCSNKDTVTVIVDNLPNQPTATGNGPICANDTIKLFASNVASSYYWTGPGTFTSTLQNPTLPHAQPGNTGWYTVEGRTLHCASAPDSIYVLVNTIPTLPIVTGNSPVCEGSSLYLSALSDAGAIYYWSGPGGFTDTTQHVVITNTVFLNAGTYTVVASYPSDSTCKSTPSSYSVVVSPPVYAGFQFSKDTICQGDTVAISYSIQGATYEIWDFKGGMQQNSTTDNPIKVAYPTNGSRTVSLIASDTGCMENVSHDLEVYAAPPATFTAPQAVCFGDSVTVVADHNYDANVSFTWNFGEAIVTAGNSFGPYTLKYTHPGTYAITLVAQNKFCISASVSDTIVADVVPDASFSVSKTSDICSDDSIAFVAQQVAGYHYKWQQAVYFNNDSVAVTYAQVRYPGYLYLNVTDEYGCTAADSVNLTPQPCCNVSLPNAFTPNGDGRNDIFRVITNGHHDIAYFRIFNRWGQVVFSTDEERKGWNGTMDGVPADAGVYYYAIRYKCVTGAYYEQKGSLTLIR